MNCRVLQGRNREPGMIDGPEAVGGNEEHLAIQGSDQIEDSIVRAERHEQPTCTFDQQEGAGVLDGNSRNHGGRGQNVLYLGGNVDFRTTRTAGALPHSRAQPARAGPVATVRSLRWPSERPFVTQIETGILR